MKRLYQRKNKVKITKKNATAGTNVNGNNKTVLTMSTSSSCLYGIIVLESIGHNIHLHWAFLRKVKNVICKRFSGNKLVLSWYGHNVSHLILASCYVRDTHCSRHFNFAIFFVSRNYRDAKISCNKVCTAPKGMAFGPFRSENGYTLCLFLSGIGYCFRGNYGSAWT